MNLEAFFMVLEQFFKNYYFLSVTERDTKHDNKPLFKEKNHYESIFIVEHREEVDNEIP